MRAISALSTFGPLELHHARRRVPLEQLARRSPRDHVTVVEDDEVASRSCAASSM
jgi:hypothetical protein